MLLRQDALYTDSCLVELLSKSEQWAFELIYERYWRCLLNAAHKRLNDQQQSEDIVQNVFMRLWNNREQLVINNLPAYLNMAVRYEVFKYLSRTKSKQYFHNLLDEAIVDLNIPDQKILSAELTDLVINYAQTLPEKRRNILVLHLQKNWTTKEIASALGINRKTVQNQLRTALNSLYEKIFL